MNIQTVIEQLGHTANEAKLYLAALDLGECTITDLANRVGMPRTSVQTLVAKMRRDGLINYYAKHRRKFWVAESPEKLMQLIKEKEIALLQILPHLQAKHHASGDKPMFRLYTGPEEIKMILDDIINTKRHLIGILSWDDWKDFFSNDFVNSFAERRHRSFLKMRLLTPKTASSAELKRRDNNEGRVTRFLPPHIKIRNTNFIYGNKVAIISLNKLHSFGIVLQDADITDTITWMFESLWQESEE